MKYMTPELLSRFRSLDDSVAEAASAEWERQCEAYLQRLKETRTNLSPATRRLLRYQFHDAKVLTMAADEVPHFSIFIELTDPAEREGKKRLELRYRLVGGAGKGYEWLQHKELAGDGRPFGWWLYDELELSEGNGPAMTHSILFTGGQEIRLTFFSVSCRRLDFFSLPTNDEGVIDPKVAGKWTPLKNRVETA